MHSKNYELPAPQKLLQTEYHPKIWEFNENLVIEPVKIVKALPNRRKTSEFYQDNSLMSECEIPESKGWNDIVIKVKDIPSISKTVFNFKKKASLNLWTYL